MTAADILKVRDLQVHYLTSAGTLKAVDKVTFGLKAGERFGLVGESGSGKSTMAFAMMRLTKPPAHIAGGEILLDGIDLLKISEAEMRALRLAQIALVPQGAMDSLNPVMNIKNQIRDGLVDHSTGNRDNNPATRVHALLDVVGEAELETRRVERHVQHLSALSVEHLRLARSLHADEADDRPRPTDSTMPPMPSR